MISESILNGLIKCDFIPVEYNTPRFTLCDPAEHTFLLGLLRKKSAEGKRLDLSPVIL